MNAHTHFKTILHNGKPKYVIMPYQQFLQMMPDYLPEYTVPHEVITLMVEKNISRLRAWREYLQLTQKEVASGFITN